MTRPILLFTLFMSLSIFGAVASGSDDDAAARIRRLADTYRDITSYEFAGRLRLMMDAGAMGKQSITGRASLVGVRPGHQRMDISGSDMLDMTAVQTPESTWTWMKMRNAYSVEPSRSDLQSNAGRGDLGRYIRLLERVNDARIVGREKIGGNDCTVIAFAPDSMTSELGTAANIETLWVDDKTNLVRRHVNDVTAEGAIGHVRMNTWMEYDQIDINRKPDMARFVFQPPAGATRMDQLTPTMPTGEGMGGKVAADFTLQDLDGKAASLAGLKGKVVVLDFWATWCGPCIVEMPRVIKLGDEFKDKDVVVLAITSEPFETAKGFLDSRKFAVRCLLDDGGKVNSAYGVQALPTLVVIDRAGMISDYFVGVRTEEVLRAAIEKARAD